MNLPGDALIPKIEIQPDHIVFEGTRFDYEAMPIKTQITTILDGLPMQLALAYRIVTAANRAYFAALHTARERLADLETKVADQAAELQHLRPPSE